MRIIVATLALSAAVATAANGSSPGATAPDATAPNWRPPAPTAPNAPSPAATPPDPTAANGPSPGATAPAPEWHPLFDGRTLAGWHVESLPRDVGKEFWQVRTGAITCDSLAQPDHDYVWLVSDGEYGDFELRLQVRGFPRSHGNSGIQFRSRYDREAGWMDGPQVDVHPPAPWRTGLLYDETREAKRWIFPSLPDWRIEPGQGPREWIWRQAGEGTGWNDIRLTAVGMHVVTTVNGITIADFDGTGVLDDEAHRRHEVGRKGHVAFQLHKDDALLIQFRDIRVLVLE